MNIEKVYSEPTYTLSLSRREMEILVTVAAYMSGRGEASFLYDLGGLWETDEDIRDYDDTGVTVSHPDWETDDPALVVEANS